MEYYYAPQKKSSWQSSYCQKFENIPLNLKSEMLTTVIYHFFIWTAQYGYNLIKIPREYTTQYGYILTAIPRKEGHGNGDNSWWGWCFPGGLELTVVISTYLIMYSTNHWVHPLNGLLPGEYTRTQYMIRNLWSSSSFISCLVFGNMTLWWLLPSWRGLHRGLHRLVLALVHWWLMPEPQ